MEALPRVLRVKTVCTFIPCTSPDLLASAGLTLNVIKPSGADPKAKLPVVVVSYVLATLI